MTGTVAVAIDVAALGRRAWRCGSGYFSIAIQIKAFSGESVLHRKPRQIRHLLAGLAFTRFPFSRRLAAWRSVCR